MFRQRRYLTGVEAAELGWYTPAGTPMTQDSWDDWQALALGVYLDGSDAPDTGPDGSAHGHRRARLLLIRPRADRAAGRDETQNGTGRGGCRDTSGRGRRRTRTATTEWGRGASPTASTWPDHRVWPYN